MHRTALVLLLALVVAGCGGGDDEGEGSAVETAPPATTAPVPAPEPATACEDVEAPEPRQPPRLVEPATLLNVERTYRVSVDTSCGTFTITLDPKASPRAAASFAALVQNKYFDKTVFHRIVPGFVIQAGDPTATGSGGPGYTTVDTPAQATTYTMGVVAMAKTQAEPPGAAGSQFFVVTAADAGLPPDYAVIGHVTEGLEVVDRIAVLGDPSTELPTQPVVIERMTLEQA